MVVRQSILNIWQLNEYLYTPKDTLYREQEMEH